MNARSLLLLLLSAISPPALSGPMPLFDAHLHYNAEFVEAFPAERVVDTLRTNGIRHAVVTGRPPETVLRLHESAGDVIVPVLGVYRAPGDKQQWMHDAGLPERVRQMLDSGPWRGIGELHIFTGQRQSPVLLQIAALAEQHRLPLLMHCDPAVIDSLYEHSPELQVVWAHAGAYPYPALLRDYLNRYPRLYVDLSMRDGRVAPGGELDPGWEQLLWEYADRFMVGVDTFSTGRWEQYDEAVERIRDWLEQLPETVGGQIAFRNAERVFGTTRASQ